MSYNLKRLIPVPPRLTTLIRSALPALLLPVMIVLCHQTADAQYLTSTRAGFVNRVEGKVLIQRAGNEAAEAGRASLGTQMKPDDQIITVRGSRVELLLSPGSYLRLDEETRVRAVSTSFSGMRFEVLSGSVIAEVSAEENATIKQENPLEIITPQGPVAIAKTGIYRFDVSDAYTDVSARNGEFWVGTRDEAIDRSSQKIKKNKVARLTSPEQDTPDIAKLDKDDLDAFDEWSFQRAETLVAAHRSVLNRSSSVSMLSAGWIFDPFYNCYTYVPFGSRFVTAYGFGFYNRYSACACDSRYWYPYYGSGPYNSAGTTTGSSVTPSVSPRVRGDHDRSATVRSQVSVGRRVDVGAPAYSPGLNSRNAGADMWRTIDSPRSWGTSAIGAGSRSIGAPTVSPGRTEGGSRTVGGESSGGRGGGRVVNN